MDKRIEENRRVKAAIVNSLLRLIKSKQFDEITISEIVSGAHVSRMAYYRNFSSKIEIVKYYFNEIVYNDLQSSLARPCTDARMFWSIEYGIGFFKTMKKHSEALLCLYRLGFAGLLLKIFNERNEEMAGDMPSNSINRYQIYLAAGASLNAAIVWIENGCKESPEEIARFCIDFSNPIV